MSYTVLTMLGSLIPTWLFFRLFRFFLKKTFLGNINIIIIGNGCALAASTILAGYGFADGGEPQFLAGFTSYLVPQLFWTVFYLVQLNKQLNKLVEAKE